MIASRIARLVPACCALLAAATASADVVVMKTGSRIACSRAVEDGDRMRLELSSGGVLHVAIGDVKRVDSGLVATRLSGVRQAASTGGGSTASGSDDRQSDGPVFDAEASRTSRPIEAEVAYKRAASAGRAPKLPTMVGAIAGVEPVPTSAQLRPLGDDKQLAAPGSAPPMDARRQAWAERSRLSPGAARTLLTRHSSGSGSRPSSGSMADAPRLPMR